MYCLIGVAMQSDNWHVAIDKTKQIASSIFVNNVFTAFIIASFTLHFLQSK